MEHISETKKSDVTMKGKYLNPNTNDPSGIPAEFLDKNGDWKLLTRSEKTMLTEGQLYAYERFWMSVVDERVLREAAVKKSYKEGKMEGLHFAARNMKQLGLPITDIAKATGLSEKEIANL